MKKLLLPIIILLFFTSCGKKPEDDFYKVHKKITAMKSYTATAEITVYGNKGVSNYKMNQYWLGPNKIKLETTEPSFLKGKTLVYDGQKWKVNHPQLNESYEINSLSSDDQMVYIGVLQGSILSGEDTKYKYINRNGNDYIEVKATLQGGNEYRKTIVLLVNKKDYYPDYMEILDDKGTVRVRVRYVDFVYNGELQDSLFNIN